MRFGNSAVSGFRFGAAPVSAVYLGAAKLWPAAPVGGPFNPRWMRFSAAQSGGAQWPTAPQPVDTALAFIRFRYDPDGADAAAAESAARGGFLSFWDRLQFSKVGAGSTNFLMYLNRPGETSNHNILLQPTLRKGDVVDAVAVLGAVVGGVRVAQTAASINGAAPVLGHRIVITDHQLRALSTHETIAGVRVGGRAERWSAGHVTHETQRAFFAGNTALPPPDIADALALFVRPDGTMQDAAAAPSALGSAAMVDFYEGVNHGSLGAPATLQGMAIV